MTSSQNEFTAVAMMSSVLRIIHGTLSVKPTELLTFLIYVDIGETFSIITFIGPISC